MKSLRTKMNLSTAFHPQTDGNTERVHRTIEQILRAFIHHTPDEWLKTLSLAEFCYNNSKHSSTGLTPFESIYGLQPLTPISLIQPPNSETPDIVNKIHDIYSIIEDQIKIVKPEQKHPADKKSNITEYSHGDFVLLSTENLKLYNQPYKKFKDRFIGPYKILQKISPVAYKLDLPNTVRIHPVFHVSMLKPYHSDTPDTDPVDHIPARGEYISGDNVYTIEKIQAHKIGPCPAFYARGPALLFKVRWAGYSPQEDTWEPYVSLKRTDEFHNYLQDTPPFRNLTQTPRYKQLHRKYPTRFPTFQFHGT